MWWCRCARGGERGEHIYLLRSQVGEELHIDDMWLSIAVVGSGHKRLVDTRELITNYPCIQQQLGLALSQLSSDVDIDVERELSPSKVEPLGPWWQDIWCLLAKSLIGVVLVYLWTCT